MSIFDSVQLIGASVFDSDASDDLTTVTAVTLQLATAQSAPSGNITAAAPLPVFTNNQIANFVRTSFGADYKWNLGSSGTAPQSGVLTYNVSDLNGAGAFLADQALAIYEAVLGIDFVKTTGTADLTFDDNAAELSASGGFFFSGTTILNGFVSISASWLTSFGSTIGTYGFQTYLHEIGHALGLGHAGNYDGFGNYVTDTTDPNFGNNSNHYRNDSWQATVMSYFSQTENTFVDASFAYLISPMVADWIALGNKYGTSAFAFSGNTTWGFNTNIGSTVFASLATYADDTAFTVFDAGGTDTVNFSGYGANQLINLNPESISNIGGLTGNMIIARGTLIENATGGSGSDLINGNAAANALSGNAGNDTLGGAGGNDSLVGGIGSDSLGGGDGNDSQLGGDGNDTIFSGIGNDSGVGGAGNDSVIGGGGSDALGGDSGNDTLGGGTGKDVLVGGSGNDVFDFNLVTESPFGAACDELRAGGGSTKAFDGPFNNVAGDRIDVSGIDANITTGAEAFIFGLPGTKGHLWCVNSGTTTRVLGNVDDDATAEFRLDIFDGSTLASAYKALDFIL